MPRNFKARSSKIYEAGRPVRNFARTEKFFPKCMGGNGSCNEDSRHIAIVTHKGEASTHSLCDTHASKLRRELQSRNISVGSTLNEAPKVQEAEGSDLNSGFTPINKSRNSEYSGTQRADLSTGNQTQINGGTHVMIHPLSALSTHEFMRTPEQTVPEDSSLHSSLGLSFIKKTPEGTPITSDVKVDERYKTGKSGKEQILTPETKMGTYRDGSPRVVGQKRERKPAIPREKPVKKEKVEKPAKVVKAPKAPKAPKVTELGRVKPRGIRKAAKPVINPGPTNRDEFNTAVETHAQGISKEDIISLARAKGIEIPEDW